MNVVINFWLGFIPCCFLHPVCFLPVQNYLGVPYVIDLNSQECQHSEACFIMCLENVNRLPNHALCNVFGECLNCPSITWNIATLLSLLLSQFSYGSGNLCCKFYRNWFMWETLTRILQNGHLSYSTVSDISILLVKPWPCHMYPWCVSIHVLSRHHRKRQFN